MQRGNRKGAVVQRIVIGRGWS